MRIFLCCFLALLMLNAYAETEYWVSVSSSKDWEDAERLQQTAKSTLSESFSLQPTHTKKGFYYRVVAGPFLSQKAAMQMVEQAKAAGFDGAWLFPVKLQSFIEVSSDAAPSVETETVESQRQILELPERTDTQTPE